MNKRFTHSKLQIYIVKNKIIVTVQAFEMDVKKLSKIKKNINKLKIPYLNVKKKKSL